MLQTQTNSSLEQIHDEIVKDRDVKLFMKRDDLIHPEISGNKWRKLKFNIAKAKEHNLDTILTFGGAFSNHIAAIAYAGELFNLKTIGIIRGEKTLPLNPTLSYATNCGLELSYMDRSTYRLKDSLEVLEFLKTRFGDFWLVPEGGYNEQGAKGCEEIVTELDCDFDYICTACGTATTIAGILNKLNPNQIALGFPALKGGAFLDKNIESLTANKNYELFTDYHFGGYAKYKPELIDFIIDFKTKHKIQLDPVYNGKMMFGLYDLIQKNYFKKGSTIVAIHTGGLQGITGFNERYGTTL